MLLSCFPLSYVPREGGVGDVEEKQPVTGTGVSSIFSRFSRHSSPACHGILPSWFSSNLSLFVLPFCPFGIMCHG